MIRGCATVQPSDEEAAALEQAAAEMAALLESRGHRNLASEATTVTVGVYVHVITNASGGGNISDTVIANQIKVLNDSYSGLTGGFNTKFRFALSHRPHREQHLVHRRPRLGGRDGDEDRAPQGRRNDLNIYFNNDAPASCSAGRRSRRATPASR